MKVSTTIFSVVLCFLLLHQVQVDGASQCYQCGENCARTERIVNCPGPSYVCTAHRIRIGGETYEAKDCALYTTETIETCSYLAERGSCYICQDDLCNSGW